MGSVVFDATEAVTSASTYNAADTITNTGTGFATLELVVSGAQDAAVTIPAANTSGLNGLSVRNIVGQTANIDAAAYGTSLSAFTSNLSSGAVAVTDLATGSTVTVVGNGALTNGNTSFDYKTESAAQNIVVTGGVTAGAITNTASTGVTTATITSSGSTANKVGTVTLVSDADNTLTTLNVVANAGFEATLVANDFASTADLIVSGSASSGTKDSLAAVNLGATFDGDLIDASAMTAGGVQIGLTAGIKSFVGGQGTDAVTTAALTTTTAGAIDGGAGNDILVVAAVADVATAAKGALYTNFETLRNNAAANVDASRVSGITAIQLNASGAGATSMSATQASAVTNLTNNTTGTTLALAVSTGATDVLSVS